MTYNQNITLDLNTNTSYVVVGAKQGDDRSRTITAAILQNGESVVFTDNDTASYRIRKPNGQANWGIATINRETNQVVIELDATDLAIPGRCQADILINSSGELLGTANFIIDVQSAPNIAEDAVKSEAFQQLSQMVRDANSIIERAQAWTEGKRGSKEVIGDSWSVSTSGSGNFEVTLDFDTFKEKIYPSAINEVRQYIFVYIINVNKRYWKYEYEREGEEIDDMSQYGIEITGTPSHNDQIIITASFADPTWHNNAKWYMEALKNASVGTVTTATPGVAGNVTANYDDDENAFTFNFDLPSVKPHVIADVNTIDAFVTDSEGKVVRNANGEISKNDASVNVTIQSCDENGTPIENENSLHKLIDFQFMVPRGEPAGFSDQQYATVNQRDPSEPPVTSDDDPGVSVHVVKGSPDTAKQFIFDFTIPPGKQGNAGPMPTFTCSVDNQPATQPEEMSVTSTETRPGEYDLHFKLLKGDKGIDGQGSVTKVMGISPVEDTNSEDFGDVLAEKIFDLIYPLGSIYITKDSTFIPSNSPNDAEKPGFGGTWSRIVDTYLYAANPTTTYENDTFGSETIKINFAEGNGYVNLGFNGSEEEGVAVNVKQIRQDNIANSGVQFNHILQYQHRDGSWKSLLPHAGTDKPLKYGLTLSGTQEVDVNPKAYPIYIWQRTALSDGTTSNSNS